MSPLTLRAQRLPKFVLRYLLQLPQHSLHHVPHSSILTHTKHFLRQSHVKRQIFLDFSNYESSWRYRSFVSISDNRTSSGHGQRRFQPHHKQNVNTQGEHWKFSSLKTAAAQFGTSLEQEVSSKFSISNPAYSAYLDSLVAELAAAQDASSSHTDSDYPSRGRSSRQSFLHSAVAVIERLKAKHQEMMELSGLLKSETDAEMQKMIESELYVYKLDLQQIEEELVDVLVGDDPADDSDIMLEVTAGVGGQEAMLFCLEIFNMYCNYSVRKGWQLAEPFSDTSSEQGGARKASVEISGEGVYRQLKHEGGVHRVQRVPKTEKAGRIHTSTITVSVMPLPKEIDLNIQQKDLKVETFRNSGPGGQSVNTTDSAVRITHIPTGTVAEGKEERSQMKNKDIAMKKLKQRMYEAVLAEQQAQIRESRKLQQGTRARSEKIRTYNFQQDRVTDHRTRESTASLAQFLMVGGEGLDGLIEGLVQQERYTTMEMILEGWGGGSTR